MLLQKNILIHVVQLTWVQSSFSLLYLNLVSLKIILLRTISTIEDIVQTKKETPTQIKDLCMFCDSIVLMRSMKECVSRRREHGWKKSGENSARKRELLENIIKNQGSCHIS